MAFRLRKLPLVLLCALTPACAQAPPQASHPPVATPQQASVQADIDRLIELARQMKIALDRTRRDELNVKVIRQADEIEKLARSTRDRLR